MSLHFHNSKKMILVFSHRIWNVQPTKVCYLQGQRKIEQNNGRKSIEYEDNISAHEVAKL